MTYFTQLITRAAVIFGSAVFILWACVYCTGAYSQHQDICVTTNKGNTCDRP